MRKLTRTRILSIGAAAFAATSLVAAVSAANVEVPGGERQVTAATEERLIPVMPNSEFTRLGLIAQAQDEAPSAVSAARAAENAAEWFRTEIVDAPRLMSFNLRDEDPVEGGVRLNPDKEPNRNLNGRLVWAVPIAGPDFRADPGVPEDAKSYMIVLVDAETGEFMKALGGAYLEE